MAVARRLGQHSPGCGLDEICRYFDATDVASVAHLGMRRRNPTENGISTLGPVAIGAMLSNKQGEGRAVRSISLNLNQALALDKLEEFVRQEQTRGAELVMGSDFERALALLITQRRIRRPWKFAQR